MNRVYEMMVIIDGDVDDPKAQSWMKTITDGVESVGGQLHEKIDWWGKRQFAYPINKKPSGYYLVAQLVAAPGALDELERQAGIENVLDKDHMSSTDIVFDVLGDLHGTRRLHRGSVGSCADEIDL